MSFDEEHRGEHDECAHEIRELFDIVRQLAESDPFVYDYNGGADRFLCHYCGVNGELGEDHEDSCLWLKSTIAKASRTR